jgi:hypothetical protein
MTTNKLDVAAAPQNMPPPAPAPQTSPVRLIVLLGLLVLAIGAFVYDYAGARPGVDAAEKKIGEFVDARNRMSVKDGARVTPDDIHKELGMQPTWVDKHDKDQYEVEYYCWWGQVPFFNMRRHYISIVYIGDEPRRFSSHYKNEVPPREALPYMQEEARRALKIEPSLPEGHAMLGIAAALFDYNWPEAERHFQLAMAHGTIPPRIHLYYAMYCLLPTGREEFAASPRNTSSASSRAKTLSATSRIRCRCGSSAVR